MAGQRPERFVKQSKILYAVVLMFLLVACGQGGSDNAGQLSSLAQEIANPPDAVVVSSKEIVSISGGELRVANVAIRIPAGAATQTTVELATVTSPRMDRLAQNDPSGFIFIPGAPKVKVTAAPIFQGIVDLAVIVPRLSEHLSSTRNISAVLLAEADEEGERDRLIPLPAEICGDNDAVCINLLPGVFSQGNAPSVQIGIGTSPLRSSSSTESNATPTLISWFWQILSPVSQAFADQQAECVADNSGRFYLWKVFASPCDSLTLSETGDVTLNTAISLETNIDLRNPLSLVFPTHEFGEHRKKSKLGYHGGIDLRTNDAGTNTKTVFNMLLGAVDAAGMSSSNGKQQCGTDAKGKPIMINIGGGLLVRLLHGIAKELDIEYMHLSSSLVQPKDIVSAAVPIAISGDSGTCQQPHLHIEMGFTDKDKKYGLIDPYPLIQHNMNGYIRFDDPLFKTEVAVRLAGPNLGLYNFVTVGIKEMTQTPFTLGGTLNLPSLGIPLAELLSGKYKVQLVLCSVQLGGFCHKVYEWKVAATVQFKQDKYSVSKTAGTASLDLTLKGAISDPVKVEYDVIGGSAIPGQDYVLAKGKHQVTFNPGDNVKPISIQILNNPAITNDRTIVLGITKLGKRLAIGTPESATVSIQDLFCTDPYPNISAYASTTFTDEKEQPGPVQVAANSNDGRIATGGGTKRDLETNLASPYVRKNATVSLRHNETFVITSPGKSGAGTALLTLELLSAASSVSNCAQVDATAAIINGYIWGIVPGDLGNVSASLLDGLHVFKRSSCASPNETMLSDSKTINFVYGNKTSFRVAFGGSAGEFSAASNLEPHPVSGTANARMTYTLTVPGDNNAVVNFCRKPLVP